VVSGAGSETALDSLEFWPPEARRKLAQAWIAKAEQVIAIASAPEGLEGLARQAGLETEEMRRLVDLTKARLPRAVVERLETRIDTSQRGLGAIKPPDIA
jgi:methylphosphotriester-DNA--protein-cysteine methyltransferase